jgi:subtilisin family serine protease
MHRESLRPCVRIARGRLHWLLALALAALGSASDVLAQTADRLDPRLMAQIQTLLDEKAARTPAQRKLDSRLVLGMKKRRGDPMFARVPELRAELEMRGDRTLVSVHAEVTPALENAIRALGGEIEGSHPEWSQVRAWMPVARLEALAARPDVDGIRPPEKAITRVTTQGDVAHGTSNLRSLFPEFDGRGVKVCVLSNGVGALSQLQAAGELPAVQIVGDRRGESGTEGTAMLEIIHDIAPGASLGFATALPSVATFRNNILALRNSGCQILVDDVGFDSEGVFQDDLLASTIDSLAASGMLYFASAGNSGRAGTGGTGSVWEGDFRGVSAQTPRGQLLVNDFGGSVLNPVLPFAPARPAQSYTLQWADPFAAAVSDFDMFLLDSTRTRILATSTSFQTGGGSRIAFEAIDTPGINQMGVALMVALTAGSPRAIHIEAFGGSVALGFSTAGHISGHAGALGADAVAAAAAGVDPLNAPFPSGIEPFSADGPRRVFFTPSGAALTPNNFLFATGGGVLRRKPDLTAADGVSTASPGFLTFFGTSAAAPHAAGIAAVIKSAAPTLPSDKLRFALKATARDVGAPGFDVRSGAGIIDAGSARVLAMAGVPCFDAVDNDGDGGVDFPGDPGCASQASVSESPACSDGVDNDSDGQTDLTDPECRSPSGTTECGDGSAQSLAVLPLLAFLARRRCGQGRPASRT